MPLTLTQERLVGAVLRVWPRVLGRLGEGWPLGSGTLGKEKHLAEETVLTQAARCCGGHRRCANNSFLCGSSTISPFSPLKKPLLGTLIAYPVLC